MTPWAYIHFNQLIIIIIYQQELLAAVTDGIGAFAAGKVEFMRNDCWELTELLLLYLRMK